MLGDGGDGDVKVGLTFAFFYTELNRKSRENIGAVRKAVDKVSNSAGLFPSM